MSAIFGYIAKDGGIVDEPSFAAMQKAMEHWEPDDKGTWVHSEKKAALGQLMLWNTPESLHEKLPYCNPNFKCTITADARIDNRDELFECLSIPKELQKTIPDSQLILKAYELFGNNCVKYLIGDFAFAIWNNAREELFCARDQVGVKPFFYSNDKTKFLFASEKKGILASANFNRKLNQRLLYSHFLKHVFIADKTLYKYINRLPPGHFLLWKAGKITVERYWDLQLNKEMTISEEEAIVKLQELMVTAVKCRLRSVYPIGAELSGGFDSATIVGIAASKLKEEDKLLTTFGNVFSENDKQIDPSLNDEQNYIAAVNNSHENIRPVLIDKPAFENPLENLMLRCQIDDGFEMWNCEWLMHAKIESHKLNIRTVLTGFGGDEMLSYKGQFYYLDLFAKKKITAYAKEEKTFYDIGFNKLIPFIPVWLHLTLSFIRQFLFPSKILQNLAKVYNVPVYFTRTYMVPSLRELFYFKPYQSLQAYLRFRALNAHPGLRMESETRMGMHFNQESRYPLMDIRLLQFFLNIPQQYKYTIPYQAENDRPLYMKVIDSFIPDSIKNRQSKTVERGFKGGVMPFLVTNHYKSKYAQMHQQLFLSVFENSNSKNNLYQKHIMNEYNLKMQTSDVLYFLSSKKNINK